jgi:pimeloyl-ACP methyl ester carboxylesterase
MPKTSSLRRSAAGSRPGGGNTRAAGSPRVRRGYFECRYGQLHVHNAIPAGGGFEEGTPLLCLHSSPLSGRAFARFLAVAGAARSVFAPDLPGFGDSDPPPPGAGVAEHAAAIGDFLDTMRLRQIDLLGQRFGGMVAAELAAARPAQVRRLVLVSPPLDAQATDPEPPAPAADGAHLLEEWRRAAAHCGPGVPPESVTGVAAERLRNGAAAAAAAMAQRAYPLASRLTQLSTPLLVLRLHEDVAASSGPARGLPARARLVELPERGASLFESAPDVAAQAVEPFLR